MNRIKNSFVEIVVIIIGCLIMSYAYNAFFLPFELNTGGAAGLSIVLHSMFGWKPSLILMILNILLVLLAYVMLGKSAFRKTILGSMIYPFTIEVFAGMDPVTDNILLAAIYGAVLSGIGIGLVYRMGASTGGSSVVVQVLKRRLNMPSSQATFIVDGLIVVFGLLVFDIENIMYSLIAMFIMSATIDFVEVGTQKDWSIQIISDQYDEIVQAVSSQLDRSATVFDAQGGYSKKSFKVVMCVIDNSQYIKFTDIVSDIDPDAFMIVSSVNDVRGRGFSLDKYYNQQNLD